MKTRFIMFNRAGVFYSEDTTTGKQHSLRTKDEAEALAILHSKNEAHRQPVLNLQIARTYLTATDPEVARRTWQTAMSDALTGVCCFGTTGSGKTSSVARHIAHGYLAAGFGFLILCSKPGECEQWCGWVKNCEREDDLVIVDAAGTWRFNPLDWEASRAGEGAGLGSNVVNLLDEIAGAISGIEDTTGSSKFWDDSRHLMLTNLVDLVILAGLQISLPLLRSIVTTAPYTPEDATDAHWLATSACHAIISEADKMTMNADPDIRADFESCRDYWMVEFPNLSDKTRSIITLTFSMLVKPFVTRPLRKIFSQDTNITPEATFDGKIIVVNLGIYLKSVKDFLIPWALMFAIVILGIPTGEALLAVVPFVWGAYGYYRVKTSNENLGG